LIALKVPKDPDRLTSFVQDHMGYLFEVGIPRIHQEDLSITIHTSQAGKRDRQIAYVSDIYIVRFVNVISISMAAILLIGAIIGLYVVQSPKKRLGMMATFTILFGIGVGLLTNVRKLELFAATAACVNLALFHQRLLH
jgi:hypothetical protein